MAPTRILRICTWLSCPLIKERLCTNSFAASVYSKSVVLQIPADGCFVHGKSVMHTGACIQGQRHSASAKNVAALASVGGEMAV